jgi:hypothetical protein
MIVKMLYFRVMIIMISRPGIKLTFICLGQFSVRFDFEQQLDLNRCSVRQKDFRNDGI